MIDRELWWQKLSYFDYFIIVLIGLGVVLIGVGVAKSVAGNKVEVEYLNADSVTDNLVKKIWIDVSGAVVKPGVYEMNSDSRVKDVLVLAGGLSEKADREWVSRMLNLAERVEDGEKLYIPEVVTKDQDKRIDNQADKVDINRASVAKLMTLSGVGEVRAGEIVKGRPYKKIEELVERKILSRSVFDKNKDRLSVY